MSVCVLQNLEKYRVFWTDFLASCREINRFSVSKIGPEPAKPTISLALVQWLRALTLKHWISHCGSSLAQGTCEMPSSALVG